MRTLRKNKQTIYYANLTGTAPIYETDEEGNIKYYESEGIKIPIETGLYENVYGNPIEIHGNIAMSGDESKTSEFGIDISGYDAILVLNKNNTDISETSIIWFESDIKFKNEPEQIPDKESADYEVLKVVPSLNGIKYVLGKLV